MRICCPKVSQLQSLPTWWKEFLSWFHFFSENIETMSFLMIRSCRPTEISLFALDKHLSVCFANLAHVCWLQAPVSSYNCLSKGILRGLVPGPCWITKLEDVRVPYRAKWRGTVGPLYLTVLHPWIQPTCQCGTCGFGRPTGLYISIWIKIWKDNRAAIL